MASGGSIRSWVSLCVPLPGQCESILVNKVSLVVQYVIYGVSMASNRPIGFSNRSVGIWSGWIGSYNRSVGDYNGPIGGSVLLG